MRIPPFKFKIFNQFSFNTRRSTRNNRRSMKLFVVLFGVGCLVLVESTMIFSNGLTDLDNSPTGFSNIPYASGIRRRCPACDSSVYSYCSDKLFHDSCCCHNPNNPYDRLPYECQYADCSFLHANTCQEHKLITACCCTNLYLFNRK